MLIKYLMLAVSAITFGRKFCLPEPQSNTVEIARRAIRAEVSAMSFQLLMGIGIVSILIFSSSYFFGALHMALSQLEHGLAFELCGFGTVAVLAALSLYFLFKSPVVLQATKVATPAPESRPNNLQSLATSFMNGFTKGMAADRQSQAPNSEH